MGDKDVVPISQAAHHEGADGNGRNLEGRLRDVEKAVTGIEAHMAHMATREFIYKAILTGIGLAATVTLVIARFFL